MLLQVMYVFDSILEFWKLVLLFYCYFMKC